MAVDTTPTVDVRARLRQVPVQELVLPVVIIALVIVGVIIRPGVFLTSDNLLNVLTQVSITGIIAIGMTFVIATGGIDLSVGSVLAAAGIAGGLLAVYGSWMFMLGAVGFALLLGSINGSGHHLGEGGPLHRHPGHADHCPRFGVVDVGKDPHQPDRTRNPAELR